MVHISEQTCLAHQGAVANEFSEVGVLLLRGFCLDSADSHGLFDYLIVFGNLAFVHETAE